jgi:LCP family protein required for cell wall assembly
MFKNIIFMTIILFSVSSFIFLNKKSYSIITSNSFINSKDFNLLLLGKPGPGYIGSENTDTILIISYKSKSNTFYLIPIPRDLIVKNKKGELEKINAFYGEKDIDFLLQKLREFSGLEIKNYFAVDLKFVLDLVDFLGGIEIILDEPVIDPITLYTIPAGKQKLNGYFIELVLRSRYNKEGDFFRQKNQIKFLIALKDKFLNLSEKEKLDLIKFLNSKKQFYQTNLSTKDILFLTMKLRSLKNAKIVPIILYKTNLLTSGYFKIYNTENVYGIYPKDGVDKYDKIRLLLKTQIK